MDLGKTFGTSDKLENEGVWIDLGEGAAIKVARAGNRANQRLLRKLAAPHRVALRSGKLPDDVMERITVQAMAETILIDWKNIEFEGRPLAYSVENATRVLSALKDFRDYVADQAADMSHFQAEREEAAAKNSPGSSAGS